jgi:hypothetical protein
VTTPASLPHALPDLLAELGAVPGVATASLDPVDRELLRLELHETAAADEVWATVGDLLRHRLGLDVPAPQFQEMVAAAPAGAGRLALGRLQLTSQGDRCSAEVELSLNGRTVPGAGEGSGPMASSKAVAGALLLALEELTEDAVIASIEELEFVDGGERASVRLRLDVDGSEVLTGATAPVLGHRPQAVARCVLTAVEPHLPA